MSNQENIEKYIKILNIARNQLNNNITNEVTDFICKTTKENIEIIKQLFNDKLKKNQNNNV